MRKFNVTVNGKSYQVEVEEVAGQHNQTTTIIQPQPQVKPIIHSTSNGGINIDAPMPGSIIKVLIEEGQAVQEGDVLFVLEAMKMENDIISSASGKVSLKVSHGDSVSTGDVLAIITQ